MINENSNGRDNDETNKAMAAESSASNLITKSMAKVRVKPQIPVKPINIPPPPVTIIHHQNHYQQQQQQHHFHQQQNYNNSCNKFHSNNNILLKNKRITNSTTSASPASTNISSTNSYGTSSNDYSGITSNNNDDQNIISYSNNNSNCNNNNINNNLTPHKSQGLSTCDRLALSNNSRNSTTTTLATSTQPILTNSQQYQISSKQLEKLLASRSEQPHPPPRLGAVAVTTTLTNLADNNDKIGSPEPLQKQIQQKLQEEMKQQCRLIQDKHLIEICSVQQHYMVHDMLFRQYLILVYFRFIHY